MSQTRASELPKLKKIENELRQVKRQVLFILKSRGESNKKVGTTALIN